MYMVSACLLGCDCKYSGGNNRNEDVISFLQDKEYIKVCPEIEGGLSTPREPSEILDGTGNDVLAGNSKVITKTGVDVTDNFVLGAQKILKEAILNKVKMAILKSKSPSCGCGIIYDGSFSGTIRQGNGVTAELLLKNGIDVCDESSFCQGE